MRIRTATQDDLDAICRVEAICFSASEAGTRESFAARLKVFPRHFLLLEDEGRLIGFVNGMVTDDRTISDVMFEQAELHKEDGKWQSVFGLDVLPEHRRKGYAGQLMRALIEHSREDGRCGCILTCKEHLPDEKAPISRGLLHPDVQGASPAVLYPIRFQESGRFPVATWRGRLV